VTVVRRPGLAIVAGVVLAALVGCAPGALAPASEPPASAPPAETVGSTPEPSAASPAPTAEATETIVSSDGDVAFDVPVGWTATEESWSYGAPDRPFEYQSLRVASPDGTLAVSYRADYENVGACQPIEAAMALETSAPFVIGRELGEPVELEAISFAVERPDGFAAVVELVQPYQPQCVPIGGFILAGAYRFVSAAAVLATAEAAEQWLAEHRQTAVDVLSTFRVLEPFDA
jgi:hypothetical protein